MTVSRGLHRANRRHQGLHDLRPFRIVIGHRRLERIVRGEPVVRAPLHGPVARDEALYRVVRSQDVGVPARAGTGCLLLEPFAKLRERRLAHGERVQHFHRIRGGCVPVLVERGGGITHDWADHREVEIDEVHFLAGAEIFVAEVTTAHDRDAVVGDPGLVVHAVVDAREADQALAEQAQRALARSERIEHADGHFRMRRQCCKARVLRAGVHVVDQQPDLDAAICRYEQVMGEECPGLVRMPDVGLDVEASACEASTARADDECLRALTEEPEGGLARMPRFRPGDRLVELRSFAERDRVFGREVRARLKLRACGESDQRQQDQYAPQAGNRDMPDFHCSQMPLLRRHLASTISSRTGAVLPDGGSIPSSAAIVGATLAGSTARRTVAGSIPAPAKITGTKVS